MQFRFEGAMTRLLARRQRLIEDGEGAVDLAGAGFGFGQGNLDEPVEALGVPIAQKFGAVAHFIKPAAGRAAPSARQPLEKNPIRPPMRQIMFSHEPRQFEGVGRNAREIAAHQFEQGRVLLPVCARGDMGEARAPRLGVADERNRALRCRPAATM